MEFPWRSWASIKTSSTAVRASETGSCYLVLTTEGFFKYPTLLPPSEDIVIPVYGRGVHTDPPTLWSLGEREDDPREFSEYYS